MSFRVDVVEGARIALLSLKSNRLRTVLTTVAIGIGVCTLLAIVGIIQGLNKSVETQLAALGSDTIFVSKFPWVMRGNWWEFRNRKDLTLREVDALREHALNVQALAPVIGNSADVSFLAEQAANVFVLGTTSQYPEIAGFDIASGRGLSEADDENQRSVVVLGADVVERLFPNMNPLGHSVLVNDKPYRVVGTLSRRGKLFGESQDLRILIPYRTFVGYYGKKRGISIAVALKPGVDKRSAEDEIVSVVRRSQATPGEKPDQFSINKPEALAKSYEEMTGALYAVAMGIGLITLLVGGIGIMNIMLVSVRERTREIGIRRALGARKRTIIAQFLMEASAISAFGGAIGTVIGLSIAKIVSEITPLAAAVQPLTIAGGIAFAGVVGLLFGIWPAARAANLDPVEALRHE